jgi:hypothetical protein
MKKTIDPSHHPIDATIILPSVSMLWSS